MKRVLVLTSVLLAVLQGGCGGGGQTVAPPVTPSFSQPAQSMQEFETRLEGLRVALKISGMSAVIVKDQRIVWSKGFGQSDIGAQTATLPVNSFHLASLTKGFAAVILLQLVQEGKLDLEAPVTGFGINIPGVKVRHLLTHTSEGTPGNAFQYNGDRYALLSTVIQQASGKSFEQLVSERIIVPLGMTRTAPNPQNQAFATTGFALQPFLANFAKPYDVNSAGAFVLSAYPSNFGAAAGLVSSVGDMALYSNALDRNDLLSAASKTEMFTRQTTNAGLPIPYGLGWFVQDYSGNKLVWHYGFWTANSSLIIKAPDRGLTFVILANSDGLSRDFNLASGDVNVSPVAREFINAFVTGNAPLP